MPGSLPATDRLVHAVGGNDNVTIGFNDRPFLDDFGIFFLGGEGFCLKTCYNQHGAASFDRVMYFATASRFRNTPAADARNFFVPVVPHKAVAEVSKIGNL